MDRVGVEPTTVASFLGCYLYLFSRGAAALERELYCSNPTQSIFINWVLLAYFVTVALEASDGRALCKKC